MNNYKTEFYKNIANIIRSQLDLLNEHSVILSDLLRKNSIGLQKLNFKITDDILLAEYTVNYKKTHSQTLLPMLDEVV